MRKLLLTDDECVYVVYSIGIAYSRLREQGKEHTRSVLDKIVEAPEVSE